jgi:hypothetical protein
VQRVEQEVGVELCLEGVQPRRGELRLDPRQAQFARPRRLVVRRHVHRGDDQPVHQRVQVEEGDRVGEGRPPEAIRQRHARRPPEGADGDVHDEAHGGSARQVERQVPRPAAAVERQAPGGEGDERAHREPRCRAQGLGDDLTRERRRLAAQAGDDPELDAGERAGGQPRGGEEGEGGPPGRARLDRLRIDRAPTLPLEHRRACRHQPPLSVFRRPPARRERPPLLPR